MNTNINKGNFSDETLKYLDLLSQKFPSIIDASTEIVNLETIINLPKGTEHFLTDLHGEHEAFGHVLRNASGVIREKVTDIFSNTLRESEMKELCTLVYYPEKKIELVKRQQSEIKDWYRITINQLISILRVISQKYTRSKVRKYLPADFLYIIEELMHEASSMPGRSDHFSNMISSLINIECADKFIVAICNVIQKLAIDRLHIVGDIYDRGEGPHIIMDQLSSFSNYDIQWGNHDILWMGAAAGNLASLTNALRVTIRYANLEILEDGYGINLLPLATFAMECYADDPCAQFQPKNNRTIPYPAKTIKLMSQMHKAISIIQFKIEAEIIRRRPEFKMENRDVLSNIDFEQGTYQLDGKVYKLNDTNFPTVDPKNPTKLTKEEAELIEKLRSSFVNSEKLQKHMRALYSNGSVYLPINGNLLYHACIPLNEDGSLKELTVGDAHKYTGKQLLDKIDRVIRRSYFGHESDQKRAFAHDYIWYLWCGADSPFYGKESMTTFERYFIVDKAAHVEKKSPYYSYIDDAKVCSMILENFGLNPETSHIINGHVPVKTKNGETPIKADGRLLVIDGGFSKSYQPETGIAGYTLMFNSYGLKIVRHEPFESTQKAVEEGLDIKSTGFIVESNAERIKVRNTDIGKELICQIRELKLLIETYRTGQLKERSKK